MNHGQQFTIYKLHRSTYSKITAFSTYFIFIAHFFYVKMRMRTPALWEESKDGSANTGGLHLLMFAKDSEM